MDWIWIILFILIAVVVAAIVISKYTLRSKERAEYVGGRPARKRKPKPVVREWNEHAVAKAIIATDNSGETAQSKDVIYKDLTAHPRSRSESAVVQYLESITGKKFPTTYPAWLVWKGKRLELDGYNEELGIALEFSGPLHTKWTPAYETYVSYFNRVVRDVVKVRLAKKHNVKLMVVDASLPSRHWRNYVLSRLYDFGAVADKPCEYIIEQTAVPFRNKQIERELGLTAEWKVAKGL